jgi:CPA1 family monovalent cation:H+ antiporter
MLDLRDNDPVGRELVAARERALRAGLASFERDQSAVAEAVRQEFIAHLMPADTEAAAADDRGSDHHQIHRQALQAARHAVLAMRSNDEIGDNAFHQMEEELDWLDMAGGGRDAEPQE